MNGAWVIGLVISLFIVPPTTPLWLWATLSGLILVVLNYIFFGRTGASGRKVGPLNTVVIGVGAALLLLELALRYFYH